MRMTLIDPSKEVHSLCYSILMAPFNTKEGSRRSIRFLEALREKVTELNQLFNTDAIKMLLEKKFIKVKNLGYGLAMAYCLYMVNLLLKPNKFLMTIWLIF
jgi:hypothetical protein